MKREVYDNESVVSTAYLKTLTDAVEFNRTTLRDQFAMAALAGMFPMDPECINLSRNDYAVEAYRVADAMLEARKEQP